MLESSICETMYRTNRIERLDPLWKKPAKEPYSPQKSHVFPQKSHVSSQFAIYVTMYQTNSNWNIPGCPNFRPLVKETSKRAIFSTNEPHVSTEEPCIFTICIHLHNTAVCPCITVVYLYNQGLYLHKRGIHFHQRAAKMRCQMCDVCIHTYICIHAHVWK